MHDQTPGPAPHTATPQQTGSKAPAPTAQSPRGRRRRTTGQDPAPSDEQRAHVLEQWQHTTGHLLRPERRLQFMARKAVAQLATIDPSIRQTMAERLWHGNGQLLLDDWLVECHCPGAAALTGDWGQIAGPDGFDPTSVLVLRELLTAAVQDIPAERDREIVRRRLGLHDWPAQSLEQVAEAFEVSPERIRQLQTRALAKLGRAATATARRLRTVLADLTALTTPTATPPASRLLGLAELLLPSLAPRTAATLLARLAGSPKAHAQDLAAEAMILRAERQAQSRRAAARQGRINRAAQRWDLVAADIRWPSPPGAAPAREDLHAARDVNDQEHAGSWPCAKLGREVAYESQAELSTVQLLSFAPQIAYYQEQPLAIPYTHDHRNRTYYPDLLAVTTDGRCILIEVKPLYEMATSINQAKHQALYAWCRRQGWGLLTTDGHRTRSLLGTRTVDPRLAPLLGAALATHQELTWPQIQAAAHPVPFDGLDLAALVLAHGWDWRHRPYRLRAPGPRQDTPGTVTAPAAVQDTLLPDPTPTAPLIPTPEEIEAARTPAGGWKRAQLAAWGVPWPPPKGWKERLADKQAQDPGRPERR
ncbi:TnsA endonuclease N-terminal domain-containing protein [Kitasatospora sp. NPDC087861]|uniref:TnsA endonuclease N-terminal domain-containing protein n=1 Tax=Kitasatospora sp. NPDC087861 TaxID=3364070 RepID=UPI00382D7322